MPFSRNLIQIWQNFGDENSKSYRQIRTAVLTNIFCTHLITVKPVWSGHLKMDKTKILKKNGILMQVKSTAECSMEHSAVFSTFIKLPVVIKIFVLSIFEWLFCTDFTVHISNCYYHIKLMRSFMEDLDFCNEKCSMILINALPS